MSIESLDRIQVRRPSMLIVMEMVHDIKRLFNPLYPVPEKIGIAKLWAHYLCRVRGRCVDPDEVDVSKPDTLRRLVEGMVEYIVEQVEG